MKRLYCFMIMIICIVSMLFSCNKKNNDASISVTETETEKIKEYLTIPIGNYQDRMSQRAMLNVDFKDQIYYFEISWGSSAFETLKWTFSGRFDLSIGGVRYNNSRATIESYDIENDKLPPTETVVYEDGTGMIVLDDTLLCWIDDQEERDEGEIFNARFEKIVEGHAGTFNQGNVQGTYGHSANGMFIIPYNTYYFISGYDREATLYYNNQPMITRLPILSGNYSYPTMVANDLLYNAYISISSWCNQHVLTMDVVEDYFLNLAKIESETPTKIVMNVNCAFKRRAILDGYIEFRITLDIANNKYRWGRKNDFTRDADIYEFDSDAGEIIIIR